MLRGIDHLVVVVPDLAAASRNYEQLGFTVVPGGRHPVGTHNALISFTDGSYIELIAFYEPSPDHRWWAPLQKGGGLVDFCMQTDDLRGDTAMFRQAGVQIDDPKPLSRVRPDGYKLSWVLSIPQLGALDPPRPAPGGGAVSDPGRDAARGAHSAPDDPPEPGEGNRRSDGGRGRRRHRPSMVLARAARVRAGGGPP
ncbi:MAG: VOC family protein [Candidatus Rokubacteria bacterium]|nr:VOC family protein [Candidatus Rokubacteria bacterium]